MWTVNIFATEHWHYQLLSRKSHIRNLSSTRVLLTRFFLPRVLRITRNICNEWDGFEYMSFLAQWKPHTAYTDHLLYVCKHSCKHKTLRSKVDNTKKQSFKDQQCGLISIKQHITEGVSLICSEKCKQTLYANTHIWINKQQCTACLGQGVITIVKDTFFTGFKELHSYDPLKHQLVLHYIFHFRVGLRGIKQQHRLYKTF